MIVDAQSLQELFLFAKLICLRTLLLLGILCSFVFAVVIP